MKKAISALAVVLLALVGAVALASPASAHHNTVTGVAVCNADTGKFDVTWTITNSEADKTETATSRLGSVNIAAGGSAQQTESVSAGTHTLDVHGVWQNEVTHDASGSVTTEGTCETPPPPPPHDECPNIPGDQPEGTDCTPETEPPPTDDTPESPTDTPEPVLPNTGPEPWMVPVGLLAFCMIGFGGFLVLRKRSPL